MNKFFSWINELQGVIKELRRGLFHNIKVKGAKLILLRSLKSFLRFFLSNKPMTKVFLRISFSSG